MPQAQTYLRCTHCGGFYETERACCKWCQYEAPLLDAQGKPRIFPDRETCRAIQISEYDQLPPEAHADCFKPPPNELTLLCNCLHCGPQGHVFEAIEMRWLENEQMWACPCTTCGGRGFSFDIHSAENKWQCDDCGHFYLPDNGDYHPENALCPKCGSTSASGWFDDDYDEADYEDEDEEFEDFDKMIDVDDDFDEDDLFVFDDPDKPEFDLGITWKESDSFFDPTTGDVDDWRIPDDIDFPSERKPHEFNDDDIPF
jgi:hypothetical protein